MDGGVRRRRCAKALLRGVQEGCARGGCRRGMAVGNRRVPWGASMGMFSLLRIFFFWYMGCRLFLCKEVFSLLRIFFLWYIGCHPYLECPQQVWHMLRTYADFRVNHCGRWRMSADVRYKSADVRASVKACCLLRTFFRTSWGYLFADVRSSMQVSLRTSAKACVKF